ncbi:hypothetical protein T03_18021 [Trichinella britovi]|uniref:Uncharacterized protein n=1 Tax=Trichinella britovi TaxID=45882 RepID=A0A0V1CNE0_TRIBR|nr:hypothetical protein T03_18021 [Trichinella britovi]
MTLGLCAPAGHDRTAAVHWKASDLCAGVSRSFAVLAKQRQPPATVRENNYYKPDQSGRTWKTSLSGTLAYIIALHLILIDFAKGDGKNLCPV